MSEKESQRTGKQVSRRAATKAAGPAWPGNSRHVRVHVNVSPWVGSTWPTARPGACEAHRTSTHGCLSRQALKVHVANWQPAKPPSSSASDSHSFVQHKSNFNISFNFNVKTVDFNPIQLNSKLTQSQLNFNSFCLMSVCSSLISSLHSFAPWHE